MKKDIKKETYCNISLFSQNTRRKWKLSTSTANVHKYALHSVVSFRYSTFYYYLKTR